VSLDITIVLAGNMNARWNKRFPCQALFAAGLNVYRRANGLSWDHNNQWWRKPNLQNRGLSCSDTASRIPCL